MIRSDRTQASSMARARATESVSNSTPTSRAPGTCGPSRRASAHRRSERRRRAHPETGRRRAAERREHLLKKTAMSCRVRRSMATRYRSGRWRIGCPSGRFGHRVPVHRGDHGMDERPPRNSARSSSRRMPATSSSSTSRPSSSLARSCASTARDQTSTARGSVPCCRRAPRDSYRPGRPNRTREQT